METNINPEINPEIPDPKIPENNPAKFSLNRIKENKTIATAIFVGLMVLGLSFVAAFLPTGNKKTGLSSDYFIEDEIGTILSRGNERHGMSFVFQGTEFDFAKIKHSAAPQKIARSEKPLPREEDGSIKTLAEKSIGFLESLGFRPIGKPRDIGNGLTWTEYAKEIETFTTVYFDYFSQKEAVMNKYQMKISDQTVILYVWKNNKWIKIFESKDIQDSDGDGIPDVVEKFIGSDPNDPTSPRIDAISRYNPVTGQNEIWQVVYFSYDGKDYKMEINGSSVILYVWENGKRKEVTQSNDVTDTDKDGIPDVIEKFIGSDPNSPNSPQRTNSDISRLIKALKTGNKNQKVILENGTVLDLSKEINVTVTNSDETKSTLTIGGSTGVNIGDLGQCIANSGSCSNPEEGSGGGGSGSGAGSGTTTAVPENQLPQSAQNFNKLTQFQGDYNAIKAGTVDKCTNSTTASTCNSEEKKSASYIQSLEGDVKAAETMAASAGLNKNVIITISGKVTEANSSPIVGAKIEFLGTTHSILTDSSGKYTIRFETYPLFKVRIKASKVGHNSEVVPFNVIGDEKMITTKEYKDVNFVLNAPAGSVILDNENKTITDDSTAIETEVIKGQEAKDQDIAAQNTKITNIQNDINHIANLNEITQSQTQLDTIQATLNSLSVIGDQAAAIKTEIDSVITLLQTAKQKLSPTEVSEVTNAITDLNTAKGKLVSDFGAAKSGINSIIISLDSIQPTTKTALNNINKAAKEIELEAAQTQLAAIQSKPVATDLFVLKTTNSEYRIPVDAFLKTDGINKFNGKIKTYVFEFNPSSDIGGLLANDVFGSELGYMANQLITYGMPMILFYDTQDNPIQIKSTKPITLRYKMEKPNYTTAANWSQLITNLIEKQNDVITQDPSIIYPITSIFLSLNQVDQNIFPPFWVFDQGRGLWDNVGMKVLNPDGWTEQIFYTIKK